MKNKKSNLINDKRPEFGNYEHIRWLKEQRNPTIDLATDDGLIEFAREFTEGLLGNNYNPLGKCFIVCFPLSGYLQFNGVNNRVLEVEIEVGDLLAEHFCILLTDGRILDTTASQFISTETKMRMPKVYLGVKPDWYKLVYPKKQA